MLFMHMKKHRAEKSGSARTSVAKTRCSLWTATGIQMQPNQQIVAKSLAAYWNGQKGKLDEWMQDCLIKRQQAPNPSDPHPASSAFVRYIHEKLKTMPKTDSGPTGPFMVTEDPHLRLGNSDRTHVQHAFVPM